jgi:hypothetical protein
MCQIGGAGMVLGRERVRQSKRCPFHGEWEEVHAKEEGRGVRI